jgi:hypothetical protein
VNAILVSSVVFAAVFGAALIGMTIRRALPEEHVGSDAKDIVRLTTGLMATMSALVLGMLVSSSKASYDASKNDVAGMSTEIVNIDRLLSKYGPETGEIRAEFRQVLEANLYRIWPNETSRSVELRPGDSGEILMDQVDLLAPKTDKQAGLKAQVTPMIVGLRRSQWLLFLKSQQAAVPLPLLAVLVSWLAAIFASFGLFAPRTSTVVVTLALGALAVSSAIFIILEMSSPFSGVLRISPSPVIEALSQMRR